MRIISGKLRGRKLTPPSDKHVRPTSDKVKEAVFSMIAEYLDEDSICVDLFSGTGNLGLEAISRGAKRVYFGDKSRESISLIRGNIKYCDVENQSVIFQGDYRQVLERIREKGDVFFLDPPYQDGILLDAIKKIAEKQLLKDGGIIVAEYNSKDTLPLKLFGFDKIKEKRYGSIGISIYESTSTLETEKIRYSKDRKEDL